MSQSFIFDSVQYVSNDLFLAFSVNYTVKEQFVCNFIHLLLILYKIGDFQL